MIETYRFLEEQVRYMQKRHPDHPERKMIEKLYAQTDKWVFDSERNKISSQLEEQAQILAGSEIPSLLNMSEQEYLSTLPRLRGRNFLTFVKNRGNWGYFNPTIIEPRVSFDELVKIGKINYKDSSVKELIHKSIESEVNVNNPYIAWIHVEFDNNVGPFPGKDMIELVSIQKGNTKKVRDITLREAVCFFIQNPKEASGTEIELNKSDAEPWEDQTWIHLEKINRKRQFSNRNSDHFGRPHYKPSK